MKNITATLIKLKKDEEIESFLKEHGYYDRGNGFFEKKYKNFRIVLEKESNHSLGWKFFVIGNFKINKNEAIQNEIKELKEIFTGFWPSEEAKKEVVKREKIVNVNKPVPSGFKEAKDELQYLVALLLSSGADFIFNNDYFISFYSDKDHKNALKLKVVKIEDSTELKFAKDGSIFYEDGEKLL